MFWIIILYNLQSNNLKNENFIKGNNPKVHDIYKNMHFQIFNWNHQNNIKVLFLKGWKPSLGFNLGLGQIRFSQFGSQGGDLQLITFK
jgi:hypothetical protein